ncbi:unnamed protein product [Durusdinium trenchii]|uniref:SET domain-containing protein n=1 Tax=Durusdinium trenchii TaxID=1381693 RepID=A0ABP0I2N1_9DINO
MNIFVGECCFLTFCRMNHSCFPNVVYISEKRQFRALRKIQKGEELLHSYLGRELLLPTELRRRLLWRSKAFECDCTRCTAEEDPMRRVACRSCAHAKEHYEVIFHPGVWLRSEPSLQGKQLAFLNEGQRLKATGERSGSWIHVKVERQVGWVLTNGRSLSPPLQKMLCLPLDAESWRVVADPYDGLPLPEWPGWRLWHEAALLFLPVDDVQTPVAEDETQEEAFSREILEQLPADLDLPCAAFTQDSPCCRFLGDRWSCPSCGEEVADLTSERLLGRLAERTFFTPKMTPALGSVSAKAGTSALKMVKRLFVRQAFELSASCSQRLGPRHWSVQWARLFLVDLAISRLNYGVGRFPALGILLLDALQELWSWLTTLDLSHDPSCFLLTRTLEAQHLLGNDPDPLVQQKLRTPHHAAIFSRA